MQNKYVFIGTSNRNLLKSLRRQKSDLLEGTTSGSVYISTLPLSE